jgi:pimeloyl-ACP methyl ester carboxylesterase
MTKFILLLGCFHFIVFSSSVSFAQNNSQVIWSNCNDLVNFSEGFYDQLCGHLVVPENHDQPDRKLIKIPFAVINPLEIDSSLSPILVTGGGGPGGAILKNYSKYEMTLDSFDSYFTMSVEDGRQLIVLENRGVGHSQPRLNCSELEARAIENYTLSINEYLKVFSEDTNKCIDRIKNSGVDITQYHVQNTAKDIEILRRELRSLEIIKSNQINLYGISYGTRVALYYEMLYPEITRAMILDSVAIHHENPTEIGISTTQNAFDLLFDKCRSDDVCNATYGSDLEDDFYKFLDKLENDKIHIDVVHPYTLQSVNLFLDVPTFVNLLFSSMYDSHAYSLLPYVIRTTINGSTHEISNLYTTALDGEMAASLEEAAYYSYLCFDNDFDDSVPFKGNSDVFKLYPLYQYDFAVDDRGLTENVCTALGMENEQVLLTQQHHIETPVLLLSGEIDPITPPQDAVVVMDRSDTAWHLVWEGVAHDVISHMYCAKVVSSWFLESPYENPDVHRKDCYMPNYELEFFAY